MRIGVLYPARVALSPENWSGTPAGIAGGLESLGHEVVAIGSGVGFNRHTALSALARSTKDRSPERARGLMRVNARTCSIRREIRSSRPLDALIAMGTDLYDLSVARPPDVPTITYDDGTLAQMFRHPDSDLRWQGFAEDAVESWSSLQTLSLRASDACCASTAWAARSMVADLRIPERRVGVVGIGHRPRQLSDDVERAWYPPRLLFVGVDWRRKNGDAVVRAFRHLRSHVPLATLDLVGGHPLLEAEDGVRCHGILRRDDWKAQRQLDGLLARATMFVLPSRFEPAGIAYLEAASAGLPVIATTEGGAGDLLGGAAILVHPDDQDSIEQAMFDLARSDTARAMGEQAARRANDLTWAAVAARIVGIVEDIS